VERQTGENHIMLFLYHVKITFTGSTKFQDSSKPIGRRHKPKGRSNSLIYQHRLEGGTNPLALPTLTGRKHPFPKVQAPTY